MIMYAYLARRCYVLLFLTIFFGGCDLAGASEDGAVAFTADQPSYTAGSTAQLHLENRSDDTFRVGSLCALRLYREVLGSWKAVWQQQGCLTVVIEVEPGARQTFQPVVPEDATPGTYRYELGSAVSNTFTIDAP
ncbi:hypothetical protein CRI93_03160 [Longimonas halophila]|uniref:Intracellular proteinase inhibitor BsuPI domain-containing protein n=1 Tax=Longimonas halophila TaxID=1469170 RepID=A0A2H3NP90_9BACT|nr:hypothetical protein [Longimonas halophila]PEN08770.1 hypothetical protein CRI93_03160 [Longimonas halophila]